MSIAYCKAKTMFSKKELLTMKELMERAQNADRILKFIKCIKIYEEL